MTMDPLGGLDMQALIDSFPYYVLIIDEDHHILMANHAVRRDLKVLPEDIIGGYCPSIVHGLDDPYPGCPLERAVAEDEDIETTFYDEERGARVRSSVYFTGFKTPQGKRIYLHTSVVLGDDD